MLNTVQPMCKSNVSPLVVKQYVVASCGVCQQYHAAEEYTKLDLKSNPHQDYLMLIHEATVHLILHSLSEAIVNARAPLNGSA